MGRAEATRVRGVGRSLELRRPGWSPAENLRDAVAQLAVVDRLEDEPAWLRRAGGRRPLASRA